MAQIIRQSTAIDVAVGPFLDDGDGVTVMSALTITQPDIRLSKNGAAFAQKSAAQTASHMENGYYSVNLSTTDTNTVGRLTLHVNESGALPVFFEFQVVEEAIYDALFAGSATGALPVSSGGIVAASFGAGAIDASAIAANAIGSSELATGAITNATFAAGAIDAAAIAANAIGASELNADAAEEIATAVWAATTRLLSAGTNIGFPTAEDINAEVDQALLDYDPPTHTELQNEIDDVQSDIAGLNDISVAEILNALKGQDRRGVAGGAGSGDNTLVLAAGDEEADDFYNGGIVILLEGAGADISASLRTRRIVDYVNSTNQITVDADWEVAPDNTTTYLILGG